MFASQRLRTSYRSTNSRLVSDVIHPDTRPASIKNTIPSCVSFFPGSAPNMLSVAGVATIVTTTFEIVTPSLLTVSLPYLVHNFPTVLTPHAPPPPIPIFNTTCIDRGDYRDRRDRRRRYAYSHKIKRDLGMSHTPCLARLSRNLLNDCKPDIMPFFQLPRGRKSVGSQSPKHARRD